MTVARLFILIPGLCYLAEACVCAWQRDWPMVIVYSGYAFANVGLLLLDTRMTQ